MNPDIVLNWHKLTTQVWETTFLSTQMDKVTAYGLHADGTLAAPKSYLPNEAIQRPALT